MLGYAASSVRAHMDEPLVFWRDAELNPEANNLSKVLPMLQNTTCMP